VSSCSHSRTPAFRADLLPRDALKVSVEAGVTLGWERFIGSDGLAIGLDRFGASGPAEVLFKHFGFSAQAIVPKILAKLGK
jgi:transketolase